MNFFALCPALGEKVWSTDRFTTLAGFRKHAIPSGWRGKGFIIYEKEGDLVPIMIVGARARTTRKDSLK